MGIIVNGSTTGTGADVDTYSKAMRVNVLPRGQGYSVSATTGTIAAALGANSSVFAMRLDPGSPVNAYVERIRLQFTTIVAFTTPVTAGRRLELYRGSGAATSGGTAIAAAAKKHTALVASQFDTAEGGDLRIASTGALTVTGITFETSAIRGVTLTHVGAAGGFIEQIWEFHSTESHPVVLEPGQLLAIRNPVAMDAAGTWQLSISADWTEAAAL